MAIPISIDLTRWAREIEDQSYLSSCDPTSVVSLIELETWRANQYYNLSNMGLYQDSLSAEHHPGQNIGLIPATVMRIAATVGVGEDRLQPYIPSMLAYQPNQDYYNSAFTITYHQVQLNELAIKKELVLGNPVQVAFDCPKWVQYAPNSSFHVAAGADWYQSIGGHAFDIEGYDATGFIAENSAGSNWGNNGFVHINYSDISYSQNFGIADGRLHIYDSYVVDSFAGMDFSDTAHRQSISQLYVSIFGRAPELGGMTYWSGELTGHTFAEVAQSMYDCITPLQPFELISGFYTNVLGRVPDFAGLTYWISQLHTKTVGQVVVDIIDAVESYNGHDITALNAQSLFNNKVAVAEYFATKLQSDNIDIAKVALIGITADVNGNQSIEHGLSDLLGYP